MRSNARGGAAAGPAPRDADSPPPATLFFLAAPLRLAGAMVVMLSSRVGLRDLAVSGPLRIHSGCVLGLCGVGMTDAQHCLRQHRTPSDITLSPQALNRGRRARFEGRRPRFGKMDHLPIDEWLPETNPRPRGGVCAPLRTCTVVVYIGAAMTYVIQNTPFLHNYCII